MSRPVKPSVTVREAGPVREAGTASEAGASGQRRVRAGGATVGSPEGRERQARAEAAHVNEDVNAA